MGTATSGQIQQKFASIGAFGRKNFKSLYAIAIFAGLLIASVQDAVAAHNSIADLKPELDRTPNFEVGSNGSNYTKVLKPEIGFRIKNLHVYISLESHEGRILLWFADPYFALKSSNASKVYLPGIQESYTYDKKVNPRKIDEIHTTPTANWDKYNGPMVRACNALAAQLRNKGNTNKKIFSVDWNIDVFFGARLRFTPVQAFVGSREVYSKKFIKKTLTCKKWAGVSMPTAGAVQAKMKITSAKFRIDPKYFDGKTVVCPVTVPLLSNIITNGKGVVKYRLRSASGKYSPVYTTTVSAKIGDGVFKKGHIVQIKVPLPTTSSGGTSGGNTFSATKTPGNVHKNSFRVETSSPNKVVSNYDGYNITCKTKASTALPGAGAITAKEKKPGGAKLAAKPAKPGTSVPVGKPDLIATKDGLSLAGGNRAWGSTVNLKKQQVAKKGLGAKKDLCQLDNVRFRPFNRGGAKSGPFAAKLSVKNGGASIYSKSLNVPALEAKSGLNSGGGWLKYSIRVKKGVNKILLQLDTGNKVAESNEKNNSYALNLKVNFKCVGG